MVLATEEEEHVQKSHGSYECALGGCQNGGSSRFLEANLRRHLRRDHRLSFYPVEDLLINLSKREEKTAYLYLFPPRNLRKIANIVLHSEGQRKLR
jgi:hypothetical protein